MGLHISDRRPNGRTVLVCPAAGKEPRYTPRMRRGLTIGLRRWDGRVRRVQRAIRRRGEVARGAAGPRPRPVNAYWWDRQSNFGDQLNVDVLRCLGVSVRWSPPREATLLAIGSVIEHIDVDFAGYVWGSGMMFDERRRLPHAKILAVRGTRTWANLGSPHGAVFGDPGLLARRTYGPPPSRPDGGRVTIVPHLTHLRHPVFEQLRATYPSEVCIIDVTEGPREVVAAVARARAVISTSLHGLIVADSYGVPAAWWQPDPPLLGGTFKFLDYESALGLPTRQRDVTSEMTPDQLASLCERAPLDLVDDLCDGLVTALDHGLSSVAPRHRFVDWALP